MPITVQKRNTAYTAFNAAYMAGFDQAHVDHEIFIHVVHSDTEEEEYAFQGEDDNLKEWKGGNRTISQIRDHGYTIRNKHWARAVRVDINKIKDDHYGVFSDRFNKLGRAARRHGCELSWRQLISGFDTVCFDGQNFFDTDHPIGNGQVQSNVASGSGIPWILIDRNAPLAPVVFQMRESHRFDRLDDPDSETAFMTNQFLYGVQARYNTGFGFWQSAFGSRQDLTYDNYADAREAMQNFKNDAGTPTGSMPTDLLVAPQFEKEAREILNADRRENGSTNVYRGSAELHVSPWLAKLAA